MAAHVRNEQRVTIRGCGRRNLRSDDAIRAGAVVDDHLMAESIGKLRADRSRNGIRSPTRGKRHDQANRFSGVMRRRGLCTLQIVSRAPECNSKRRGKKLHPFFLFLAGSHLVELPRATSIRRLAEPDGSIPVLRSAVSQNDGIHRNGRSLPARKKPALSTAHQRGGEAQAFRVIGVLCARFVGEASTFKVRDRARHQAGDRMVLDREGPRCAVRGHAAFGLHATCVQSAKSCRSSVFRRMTGQCRYFRPQDILPQRE